MIKVILAFATIFANYVSAQEPYQLPDDELPITYLKKMPVADVSRQLNEVERDELVRLLIRSYVTSARRYKQDYLLEQTTPVYQLLKTNFPGVAEREKEGGIFLGQITRFFNRVPKYRRFVEQALKEDFKRKERCHQ